MADVGLDADLVLDIRAALEQTRRLERALDAATSGLRVTILADADPVTAEVNSAIDAAETDVVVTGEADPLTGEVNSAIDAADTDVTVTGEADALTGEVNSAIDAAETDVTVTGDADAVTGEVTSAIDAADTETTITGDASQVTGAVTAAVDAADTTVSVDVDGSPQLREAAGSASDLAENLTLAGVAGGKLGGVLAAVGAAGAARGLFELVNAASELEQAVGGTTAVFGEAEAAVVTFAEGAAEAAGLSEESARTLTSQIGALLQGFGFTRDEAAKTSVSLAQLGADLAATFGGTPEDAVMALGAALRGEFDPLERFGVSLNVTQANLRAVELGLADSTNEVDLNARAQGALSLIMERSAAAQGQFGRELDTTGGQLAVARAEAQNTAAAIGATLAPAFVELLGVVREDILPAIEDLGTELGPALGSAVSAGVPILRGAIQVLVALTPAIEAFANVIEAIPEPVLQMVGTFLALRQVTGPLGSVFKGLGGIIANLIVPTDAVTGALGRTSESVTRTQGAFSRMAAAISPANVALAAGAVAFSLYAQRQADAAREAAEMEAQAEGLRTALTSADGAVEGLAAHLTELIRAGEDVQVELLNMELPADFVFDRAGLSAEQFAEAVASSDQPLDRLIDQLTGAENNGTLAADALRTLAEQTQEQAQRALEAGEATDQWTEREVEAALQQTKNRDGSLNYVAALDQLAAAHQEAEQAAEAQAEQLSEQEQILQDLATTAPAVTLLLAALGNEQSRNAQTLGQLAIAAQDAGLSQEELEAVLAQMGATGPNAAAALEQVADVIAGVREAGLNTLPTLKDIAGEVDEFSLANFRDELQESYDAIVGFNDNLLTISNEGGPRLAAAAAELGPQYAAAIADGIRNGEPEVVEQVELLLAGIEGAGTDTETLLTQTIGPNLAVASGDMGRLVTDAFGNSLSFDPTGQIVNLDTRLTQEGPGVATRARELAESGNSGFSTGFDLTTPAGTELTETTNTITNRGPQMSTATQQVASGAATVFRSALNLVTPAGQRTDEARQRIRNAKDGIRGAGSEVGAAGAAGFGGAARGMSPAGAAAVHQAASTVRALAWVARTGGRATGEALGDGMATGIAVTIGRVRAQAVAMVNAAVAAARAAAQVRSPSRVFAEIGEELTAGLAVGMASEADQVVAAAEDIVAQAAAAAAGGRLGVATVGNGVLASAATTGGIGSVAIGPGAFVFNFAPGTTPAQARALSTAATQPFREVLAGKRIRSTARNI